MRNLLFLFWFSVTCGMAYSQDLQTEIIGIWEIEAFDSKSMTSTLVRTRKIKKDKRAYEFKENGKVIVRVNSSGCVVIGKNGKSSNFLDNVIGSWKIINEKQVEIYYETFVTETFEIAEINAGQLEVKRMQKK